MESAKALRYKRGAREIRTDCVKRIAWRRDRLKVKCGLTIGVLSSSARRDLLSGPRGAVTVRRLRIGAEAKNVDVIDKKVMLANMEQTWGRNERTVALVGKLSYFPAPRSTRR